MVVVKEVFEIVEKIKNMEIRGVGKIVRLVVYVFQFQVEKSKVINVDEFWKEMKQVVKILFEIRFIVVFLLNVFCYVMYRGKIVYLSGVDFEQFRFVIINVVKEFIYNLEKVFERIGEFGVKRIEDGDVIMIYCYSKVVISVMKIVWEQGKDIKVIVIEIRFKWQGKIIVKEFVFYGILVIYVVDLVVRYYMKMIDKVVMGVDLIIVNGVVINKIGIVLIVLIVKEYRVWIMIVVEIYKFYLEMMFGQFVEIEMCDLMEVIFEDELKIWLKNIEVWNLVFDVILLEYVDVIIIECGIILLYVVIDIFREEFGWVFKYIEFWED